MNVYSPIDEDKEFRHDNKPYVLKANSVNVFDDVVGAHALRAFKEQGAVQGSTKADIDKAEQIHTDYLLRRARSLGIVTVADSHAEFVKKSLQKRGLIEQEKPAKRA